MPRVLLVYSQLDQERALRLLGALRTSGRAANYEEYGFEPDAEPARLFEVLQREALGATALIVCVSQRAFELGRFRDQLLPILSLVPLARILVRLDDVQRLPSFLSHLPTFNLFPDEAALRDGVRRILDAILPLQEQTQAPAPSAPVGRRTDDDILDVLYDKDDDTRARMVEELRATAGSVDHGSLVERILRDLEEKVNPRRAFELRDPSRAPAIRSWLLSALGAVSRGRPDALVVLRKHTEAVLEEDQWVRYWSLASLYHAEARAVVRDVAVLILKMDSSGLVRTLAETILALGNDEQVSLLQSSLLNPIHPERRWHILRALRIVAFPSMVPTLCELLSRTVESPIPYDAAHALIHPELVRDTSPALAGALGVERAIEVVLLASTGSSRGNVERFSQLLQGMDRGATVALLEKEAQAASPERAEAARRLLHDLGGLPDLLAETSLLASVLSDTANGADPRNDKLGINAEVRTLCSVLLAKNVHPPLSVGLFGDWGTGKSFFIERMRAEVKLLAELSGGTDSAYHSNVAQITFNAWHYVDTNLWASLVSHIFEQLALQVSPSESPELARARLLKELETARALRDEADAEKKRAEQQRETAETALETLAAQRAEREVRLNELRMTDLPQVLAEDEKEQLKERLTGAMKALGIPAALGSVQELDEAIKEAHSLTGRARSALLYFQQEKSRGFAIVLVALALVAVPLLAWGINKVMEQPFVSGLTAFMGEVVVVVGGAATLLRKYLGLADEHLKSFEGARKRVAELLAKKREAQAPEELALEKSIAQLRGKEDAARERLSLATVRVQELEQQLREIEEGRSLSKFLLERVQGDDYRKHLGVISVVRRDFERLESLLRESEQLKTLNRIILYIDDLDRCPADKVVDVLQAVHLLLAVPLFVVVVGVDSRWLLHSLERQFTAFQQEGGARREAWMTTPQAYLEKIFQLPFTLKRMQPAGYEQLMGTLLPRQAEKGDLTGSRAPREALTKNAPAAPVAPAPAAATKAEETSGAGTNEPQEQRAPAAPQPEHSGTQDAVTQDPAETRDLKPRALEIRSWEGALADRLYSFIPTPRAAKRFANIYRVLKAGVRTGADLSRFEGTKQSPGDFQAAMLLLAILTGFPRQASVFFPYLLAQASSMSWRSAFAVLQAPPESLGLDPAEARALWTNLEPLLPYVRLSDSTVAPFKMWAPKVARFSFETARSVSGHVEDPRVRHTAGAHLLLT